VTEKKTPPKKTSDSEHESAGNAGPERKSANVTMRADRYDELAKTASRMRWTVPQYIGFLAEATALKTDRERVADVWRALDTNTDETPAEPAISGDLAGALA